MMPRCERCNTDHDPGLCPADARTRPDPEKLRDMRADLNRAFRELEDARDRYREATGEGPPRASPRSFRGQTHRWREMGLVLEEALIQICKNPVAAIVCAVLIGLAIAVIQVECGR